MPYALFSNDARLSKAYPTEADVWKVAGTSGLVVDVATEEKANPHPVLDNHYEIRPCDPEPNEDSARNKAEAEGDAWTEPKKPKKAKARLLLLLVLALLAPVTAQAGVAERSLTHANAKVRTAVLHDVCEVHRNEKRDQLDAEDRAAYASILKELHVHSMANDDPDVATQTFCEFGHGLQKPPAEPQKP
jgi:hypothetical protein